MTFDPDSFMSQTVDAPKGDTTLPIVPEGEYRAMIGDFDANAFRTFEAGPGAKNPGKQYTVFEPPFVIDDAGVAATLGIENPNVRSKGMFLDFAQDGSLDFGKHKNVDLNRLRDAVGQNVPGPWSFNALKGAGPVMVKVIHEPDSKDPEKKYARVSKVTKIG